jgi:DNA sulfur modification protein DndD
VYLQKIKLLNFRQFYGNQEISFSCDPLKNVTLIHAENGVGKTTLLNALLWCFYKDTTTRFEDPDKIVSNQAIAEGEFEASVQVSFTDNGRTYVVERKINQQYGEETFEAFEVESGNFQKLKSAEVFVESVIPKEMSKYFFFDGEYAETFSSSNNKKAVQKAVESMLGCNLATQALADLDWARKRLEKEIADVSKGDQQAAMFQGEIDKQENHRSSASEKFDEIIQNREFSQKIRDKLDEELRSTEGAAEIQIRKEELVHLRKNLDHERKKLEGREVKWINSDSLGLLSGKVFDACTGVIELANLKGHIPSKIAETFVNDILEKGVCICGRDFEKDSSEAREVSNLIKEASTVTMNDRLMSIRSRMGRLTDAKERVVENYSSIHKDLSDHDEKIGDIELEIKECETKLSGSEIREIAEKQNALKRKEDEIEEYNKKIGALEKEIHDLEEKIAERTTKRDRILSVHGKASGIKYKLEVLEGAYDQLEKELSKYREESRNEIKEKVDNILKLTARRDYHSSIDESFSLNMHYSDTEEPVAKSSGENQLLSLAFIASLVNFSAGRRDQTNQLLKPGTMAPLMLDSPFGQLDPTYRESTAEFLPSSSGQVILLLSQTQGDEAVIGVLRDKIGEECVLISEVTTERGDKPQDLINIGGKQIACSVYGADKNRTLIVSID